MGLLKGPKWQACPNQGGHSKGHRDTPFANDRAVSGKPSKFTWYAFRSLSGQLRAFAWVRCVASGQTIHGEGILDLIVCFQKAEEGINKEPSKRATSLMACSVGCMIDSVACDLWADPPISKIAFLTLAAVSLLQSCALYAASQFQDACCNEHTCRSNLS